MTSVVRWVDRCCSVINIWINIDNFRFVIINKFDSSKMARSPRRVSSTKASLNPSILKRRRFRDWIVFPPKETRSLNLRGGSRTLDLVLYRIRWGKKGGSHLRKIILRAKFEATSTSTVTATSSYGSVCASGLSQGLSQGLSHTSGGPSNNRLTRIRFID